MIRGRPLGVGVMVVVAVTFAGAMVMAPEPAAATKPTPPTPQRKAEPSTKRGKKNHPIVPSWEDVLLGVRTQRG